MRQGTTDCPSSLGEGEFKGENMKLHFYKFVWWFIGFDIAIAETTGRSRMEIAQLKQERDYWSGLITLEEINK